MKCSKTGPKPLFEIELLSKAALPTVFYHSTNIISLMLLTNSAFFSCLTLPSINQLILNPIKVK